MSCPYDPKLKIVPLEIGLKHPLLYLLCGWNVWVEKSRAKMFYNLEKVDSNQMVLLLPVPHILRSWGNLCWNQIWYWDIYPDGNCIHQLDTKAENKNHKFWEGHTNFMKSPTLDLTDLNSHLILNLLPDPEMLQLEEGTPFGLIEYVCHLTYTNLLLTSN